MKQESKKKKYGRRVIDDVEGRITHLLTIN